MVSTELGECSQIAPEQEAEQEHFPKAPSNLSLDTMPLKRATILPSNSIEGFCLFLYFM